MARERIERTGELRVTTSFVVAGLSWVPVFLAAAGCEPDTRISPAEFLAMQDEGLLAEPTATQPTSQPADAEPWGQKSYRIGAGDTLRITISGLEQVGLPGTHTVRVEDNGTVVLPSVGAVSVTELTLDEAQSRIQSAYVPRYIRETRVTVEVTTYRTIEVMVLGEVRTPAAVQLRGDRSSVLQALLAAGGPNDAAGSQVMLIPARKPGSAMFFDLGRREGLIRAARTGVLEDADVLVVDRRSNDVVYVQGLVNTPGSVPLPRGATISALQSVAAAGGTLLAFEPVEATLMRRRPTGELVRVKLNLQKMLKGQEPDLALAAGDILIVPHTIATRLEEYAARNLTLRAGVNYDAIQFEQARRAIHAANTSQSLADSLTLPSITPPSRVVTPAVP